LLLILLLALVLRFCCLDAQSLWNDEGTSVAVAQRDVATIVRDAAHDIHPPFYYLLLHGWVRLLGTTETAVRSLSAFLGVILVAVTCGLGRLLVGQGPGLLAALLVAINPFQVYYSQEARMYVLLALLTAGSVWALASLASLSGQPAPHERRPVGPLRGPALTWTALILLEAAGLYTHYSFAFIILVLNLAYTLWMVVTWRTDPSVGRVLNWLLSQVAVVLLYLPWLSTAIRQLTTWPKPAQPTALGPALVDSWRWLVLGPTARAGPVDLLLIVVALLATAGALRLGMGQAERFTPRPSWSALLLLLWLGLPLLLIFVLGLYREAYLKFLLVTTPSISLMLASALFIPRSPASTALAQHQQPSILIARLPDYLLRTVQLLALLLIIVASILALRSYFADPAYARDDYRGIAAYIDAAGQPGDAVLLNAPGQKEVFGYYYHGNLPVYPLPKSRPLDPAESVAALEELSLPGATLFCVFWATDESDPGRFIEGWLDTHAYKALDSWHGNVRLVLYAVPKRTPYTPDRTLGVPLGSAETGDEITLLGYSLLEGRLAAGEIAQTTLFWRADRIPSQRYKVFLHLLDLGNQIVGQRDTEPGSGVRPTTLWEAGEIVVDNYGVPIHPATPPGSVRLEVGIYDPVTGQRLTTTEGESQVWLDPLEVLRPAAPAPVAALGMQHSAGASYGELTLLGYDMHKLGFAHQPDASLQPGNVLHVNLYWRAESQPRSDWRIVLVLEDTEDREWAAFAVEPVGGYPTSEWLDGDVWRGQFNLTVPAGAPPGRYRLQVQPIDPGGQATEPFQSVPFNVTP
jgi:uncharacterized membrane protein